MVTRGREGEIKESVFVHPYPDRIQTVTSYSNLIAGQQESVTVYTHITADVVR